MEERATLYSLFVSVMAVLTAVGVYYYFHGGGG
jgi:hypothetical protein